MDPEASDADHAEVGLHGRAVGAVAVLPDGRVVSGGSDGRVPGILAVDLRRRVAIPHSQSRGQRFKPMTDCIESSPLTARGDPPFCADFGSMPIMRLAVQIWAFCASRRRADGIAGYILG